MSITISNLKKEYPKHVICIVEALTNIQKILDEAKEEIAKGNLNLGDPEVRDMIWNNVGEFFFKQGMFTTSEYVNMNYYHTLESYDKAGKVARGGAIFNMGISQINQGNYELGVPNILKALDDDRLVYGVTKAANMKAATLRESLRTHTASMLDRDFLFDLMKNVQFDAKKKSSGMDLLDLLPSDAERLLLAKSLNTFAKSPWGVDIFSKVIAFDNLKIVCLLLEHALKKGGIQDTIVNLIKTVFVGTGWQKVFAANTKLTHFDDTKSKGALSKFEGNLGLIRARYFKNVSLGFSASDYCLVEVFLFSCLIRNLTAHLFDLNASVLASKVNYEDAFKSVVSALLYSLHFQS